MKTNIIIFDRQDITRIGIETLISKLYRPDQMYRMFCVDTKSSLVHHLTSNPDSLVVIDYTLSDLYRKLEVNNSQEASMYALRAGILDSSDYYI